ncbi:MAG: DUF5009 domain-containing protein [Alistipes sp.]
MSGAPFRGMFRFSCRQNYETVRKIDVARRPPRVLSMLFIMGFASFVVAVCGLWPSAVTDAAAASMSHVAWDGFAHHDTIFPLFLFIAGVSCPARSPSSVREECPKGASMPRSNRRGLTLVVAGHGLQRALPGVGCSRSLRIASVAGTHRAGVEHRRGAVSQFRREDPCGNRPSPVPAGYGALSALARGADAAGAGPLTFEGIWRKAIDRHAFLPGKLIHGPFDPEGLLSTVPAVVTAMLGMFTGEFVRRGDIRGGRKTLWMAAAAAALLAAGLAFSGVLPVNKKLWSSTFVCVAEPYSLGMFCPALQPDRRAGLARRWTTLFFRISRTRPRLQIYLAQRIVGFGRISDFFLGGIASEMP